MPRVKENWCNPMTKAEKQELKINQEIDDISKVILDALNGDCSSTAKTQKAYHEKGIIPSERSLTNWGKNQLNGVDFRRLFRSLILAGYEIEISLKKGCATYSYIQDAPGKTRQAR